MEVVDIRKSIFKMKGFSSIYSLFLYLTRLGVRIKIFIISIYNQLHTVMSYIGLCNMGKILLSLALIFITELFLYFLQSWPCLSVMTRSCVTSQSVGPSWMASPGSRPAHMFSVISTDPVSSAALLPSARPAPPRCLGNWTLWGQSCRPPRTTKPWCWQVCDQM